MATLRDNYTTGPNNYMSLYGAEWVQQTFTTTEAYTATSVKLQMFKAGTPVTPVTAGIRATSGGKPTGSDLCSGTIDPTTFTTSNPGTLYEITLGAGYNLDSSVQYSIVVRCINSTGAANSARWNMNYATGGYAGGQLWESTDSGATWTGQYDPDNPTDLMFQVWGDDISVIKTNPTLLLMNVG